MIPEDNTTSLDSIWNARADDANERLASRIQAVDSEQLTAAKHDNEFAFIGFCCDAGVARNLGRPGAKHGPDHLRQALANLPLHRSVTAIDIGDINCIDDDMERAQQRLADNIALCLSHGYTPIALGGGHEIAWASYQGLRQADKHRKLAIINFDAHLDMRPMIDGERGSSGTPFLQIANSCKADNIDFNYTVIGSQSISNTPSLYKTADEYGVKHFSALSCAQEQHTIQQYLSQLFDQVDSIYLTICMDVFNGSFAPGVSAVNPQGIAPWHALPLVRQIAKSGKLISCDVAELSPAFDQQQITAKCASSLLNEIIYA